MRKIRTVILSLLLPAAAAAQNYGAHMIPEELTKGVNAVIRQDITEYEYQNKKSATERHTLVVTVLNDNGDHAAAFFAYTDKTRSLKSFSGEIYDRTGAPLRKIKRSELKVTESSEGLADDMTVYYFTPNQPSYPYTVKYSYEVTQKDGITFFPSFIPLAGAGTSLEKASYTLSVPAGTRFHTRNVNTDIQPEKSVRGPQEVYVWSTGNLRPPATEPYGPGMREIIPIVYLTPHEFSYNGIEGVADTWENYARWQWKLMEGRQELPAPLKAEIARLTQNAASDIDKIRALYDYLAATTRYVSIQIGIGGLQPMSAEEVFNRRYGDCKGLSNYLRAMLAECGIPACYVEIGMHTKDIIPDYASPLLSNHAILAVPQATGGMLWIECTAPELPLGFIHSGIAGQHALVYKDGSAHIEKVPVLADSLHLSRIEGTLKVAADGTMSGHVAMTDACNRYEEMRPFSKKDARERANQLQKLLNLPLATISGISFTEQKSATPSCTTSFEVSAGKQAGATPGRIFLDNSPFRKAPGENPGRSKRKTDIVVRNGYRNTDSITIEFDESYQIEALPAPLLIRGKYGTFRQVVLPVGGKIVIERLFQLNTGKYPPSEYEAFKQFIETAQSGYASKIVLRKK